MVSCVHCILLLVLEKFINNFSLLLLLLYAYRVLAVAAAAPAMVGKWNFNEKIKLIHFKLDFITLPQANINKGVENRNSRRRRRRRTIANDR